MKSKKILVFFAALLAFVAVFASSVNAFGIIRSIEVKGEEGLGVNAPNLGVFAGETLPVRVTFIATNNATDARVKVWIAGAREYAVSSERFRVLDGSTYSKLVSVQVPFDIDPSEDLTLKVSVESGNDGSIPEAIVKLAAQRESYIVEILDVNFNQKATAGDMLALNIVLKNRGIEFAEDTFVKVSIPQLGIEEKAYFGDLAPVDQDDPDKEDAAERRMYIAIPSNTKAGIYNLELESYNSDSATSLSKKIAIVGAIEESTVVAPMRTRTFAVSEEGTYRLTVVNAGNRVHVYDFIIEADDGLSVEADEPVFAVPAGTSKTLLLKAKAAKAGEYKFTVNVNADGNSVKSETFTAMAEGKGGQISTGNTTVLLTVVLAIIFVVLLVVLIVLLTRKPEKTKEFGESYY